MNIKLGAIGIGLILSLIIVASLNPFVIVEPGHRGIKVRMGEVIGQPLEEGIHFKTPMVEKIILLDTRTKRLNEAASTYTQDVQKVTVDYVVNYNLKRTEAGNVFKEIGTQWENTILLPACTGNVKEVVGKWDAVDLVGNRDKAVAVILTQLQEVLNKKGITVTGFEITNIKFDADFEGAVEAKVTAVQRAEEAKNKTVQVQEEANQKVVSAKAEAEAMRIKTEALAKSPALVQYEAVMAWSGKLPNVLIVGGMGALPLLNLPLENVE